MRTTRISQHASAKVLYDCFPSIDNEQLFQDMQADSRDVAMSAGALCLYAATLLIKVYDSSPEYIDFEAEDRELALRDMIRSVPKNLSLTDDEVATRAHSLLLKDIRNSFEHGNFEISYDTETKELYYVLKPRRKGLEGEYPIIISKEALFNANHQALREMAEKFDSLTQTEKNSQITTEFGAHYRKYVLPIQMLKLAENYLVNGVRYSERYKPNSNGYLAIYYPLLVSQMTYEQDEYYNLFNKDSNIFAKIAFIRNAVAHNGFKFDDKLSNIEHTDREIKDTDSLKKSVRLLKLARDHKNLVKWMQQRGMSNTSIVQYMIESIKKFFDSIFIYGGYEEDVNGDNVKPE